MVRIHQGASGKTKPGQWPTFDLAALIEQSRRHVYRLRLLTLDPIADARCCFKFSKALSDPKHIK